MKCSPSFIAAYKIISYYLADTMGGFCITLAIEFFFSLYKSDYQVAFLSFNLFCTLGSDIEMSENGENEVWWSLVQPR